MIILIKGMEMPKEEEKILIAADGSVWVNAWPTRGYMKMKNAKVVPLPEKHGRLIDAEALIKEIDDRSMSDSDWWYEDRIDEMPTIIEAEGGTEDG